MSTLTGEEKELWEGGGRGNARRGAVHLGRVHKLHAFLAPHCLSTLKTCPPNRPARFHLYGSSG